MNIISSGLTCPQCKLSYSFSSRASACIRLYARCCVCAQRNGDQTKAVLIDTNRDIWLKQERKLVFGEEYAG